MKTKISLLLLIAALCVACQKNTDTYKYQDKPDIITCSAINYPLIKEAFYSFENDLYTNSNDSLQANIEPAYSKWLYPSHNNTFDIKTLVSPYTVQLFERLKKEEPQLFNLKNPESNLNYESDLISCIVQNMRDEDLKTTFKALLETNTMSPKLIGERLTTNLLKVTRDPYMRYYTVFEYGYGRMFFNDFSEILDNE